MLKERVKSVETEGKLKASEKSEGRPDLNASPDELRLSPDAIEAQEEFAPLDLPTFDLGTLDTTKY